MNIQDKLKLKIAQTLAVKGVLTASLDFVLAVQEHGGWKSKKLEGGRIDPAITIIDRCPREYAKLEQAVNHFQKIGSPLDG